MDKLIPLAVVENQTAAQETSSVLLFVVHDAIFPLVLSPVFFEHSPCPLSSLNSSGVMQRDHTSLMLIRQVSPRRNAKME